MKRNSHWIAWVVVGVLAAGTSAGGDSGSVNAALKQVSKATKGVRGVVAEVEYTETVGRRPINGSGKIYVSFDGLVRAEVGGDLPRTLIFNPPYLYIHREADRTVEVYDITFNPHMLGQYMLLGFVPNGKDMKKSFKVELVPNSMLDGNPVLSFLMTPKAEEIALAMGRIQLWVDPESGLPAQHKLIHASGESQLDIRYLSMSRDDELSPSLFQPRWPAGTKTVPM